jgi:hypothetical protein
MVMQFQVDGNDGADRLKYFLKKNFKKNSKQIFRFSGNFSNCPCASLCYHEPMKSRDKCSNTEEYC